jgi:hypothetical protein
VHERPLRAPRANRVFCADEKRIRTENAVMDESTRATTGSQKGIGGQPEIVDCMPTVLRLRNIATS